MGLEIAPSKRVVKDPDNTSNWTNRRKYSWSGNYLFTYEVEKGEYRKPPTGFKLEWTSFRSIDEIARAAIDFYSVLRSRYGFPQDAVAKDFTAKTIQNALILTAQLEEKGLLLEDVVGRSTLEPVHLQLKPRRNIFYSNEGDFNPESMKKEFTEVWSSANFAEATFASPYGDFVLNNKTASGTKHLSIRTRYNIPHEVLGLIQATSITPIDIHQRSAINERLRKPIKLLPKPDQAA